MPVHSGSAEVRPAPGRIFVHIGTHKTGSTSIQHFLTSHAETLRSEGILVPAAGRHLFGHHHVAWELRDDERLEGRIGSVRQLLDELRASALGTAVISSEDFEYLAQYPARLRGFVGALRAVDYEPVFVVFFRERRAYLASLVATLSKLGVPHAIEWYEEQLQQEDCIVVRKDWRFDVDRNHFVSRWTEITAAALTVFDYDACAASHGVVPALLGAVGASDELISAARNWPRSNVRVS